MSKERELVNKLTKKRYTISTAEVVIVPVNATTTITAAETAAKILFILIF